MTETVYREVYRDVNVVIMTDESGRYVVEAITPPGSHHARVEITVHRQGDMTVRTEVRAW